MVVSGIAIKRVACGEGGAQTSGASEIGVAIIRMAASVQGPEGGRE